MRCLVRFCLVVCLCSFSVAQVLTTRPPQPTETSAASAPPATPKDISVPLTVPSGTPLKISLDQELRIREVGQAVHARTVEPVYAFDKLVIPAGSEVIGKVASIAPVTKTTRTLDALNANFSPYRDVKLSFSELRLADGRRIPLNTTVSPATRGALQLVPANQKKESRKDQAKNAASRKLAEAKAQVRHDWDTAMQQIHEPGKTHKLERLAVAQLPYHPQYMDSGTGFNADLNQPLSFGAESLRPEALTSIGTAPPDGSILHAVLVTPLSSATAKKDDAVEAMITQPLVADGHLFVPQGSRLTGRVTQVREAGRLRHNGQLRIVFQQLAPPDGVAQKIEASLEGVAVGKDENLKLDSEGGAQVTSPHSRYFSTALQVALATSSMGGDHDGGLRRDGGGGDMGGGAVNGFSGFRLVGMVTGALAHSRIVSTGFGVYGAAMSVYSHFLARGRDVVYPKDMSMVIGLGTREPSKPAAKQPRKAWATNPS